MAVSKDEMLTSYVFTFAILLTVMTNVCQYFWNKRPPADNCWDRNGAVILMVLSTIFILISPLKNLVVNVCMDSFRTNGFDSTIETVLDIAYMPWFGTKPTQMYTAIAYVLMMWATLKQVNFYGKLTALTMRYKKSRDAAASAPPRASDDCPDGS